MDKPIRQAVIMASGLGTRLRPHTLTCPKPMLRVAGRPILEWTVERLPSAVEEVILVVSYLKEQVTDHFGDSWQGRRVTYVEQPAMKGTGDAVRVCRPHLDERFVVLNGDDIYDPADLDRAVQHDGPALFALPQDDASRFGALQVEDGRLRGIRTRREVGPGACLVNIGLYTLDRQLFDYPLVPIKDGREYGLPQQVCLLGQDRPVVVLEATAWCPIGYPEDLDLATDFLQLQTQKMK